MSNLLECLMKETLPTPRQLASDPQLQDQYRRWTKLSMTRFVMANLFQELLYNLATKLETSTKGQAQALLGMQTGAVWAVNRAMTLDSGRTVPADLRADFGADEVFAAEHGLSAEQLRQKLEELDEEEEL